jgi:hypothetical protein
MLSRNRIRIAVAIIGCLALWSSCGEPKDATFNEDVAPILYKHCVSCHRPDGAAPFSLMTYKEAWKKKKTILKVTKSGYMPPWPADPAYSHFLGEKFLNEQEKRVIEDWVSGGAKEGPTNALPMPPQFPGSSLLGKPDLTLTADSFFIPGDNRDRFLLLKLPFQLDSDTFIRAVEFIPGKNGLVHHMNGHLLMYQEEQKKDVFKGRRIMNIETDPYEAYVRLFESMMLYNDDGSIPRRIHSAVNYLPGVEAQMYPEGIGGFRIMRKGVIVANDIHYGPQPKGVWDQSKVNIFFASKAPEREVAEIMLGTNGVSPVVPPLKIPPNKISTFRTEYTLPADISILTINPHLHLLGSKFLAYALKPTGDTIRLISIPKWDFRWQYFYTYPSMLPIPAGSRIVVEATFDNTNENPFNPNHPPDWVSERLERGGAGMRTTDEMLQFIISYTPYKPGDEKVSLKR